MANEVKISNVVIPALKGDTGVAGKIKSISIEIIDNDLPAEIINNGSESEAELLLRIPKVKEVEQILIDEDMHMIINYNDGTTDNVGTLRGVNEIKVENGHLIFTLSDETVIDTGYLYDDAYIQEKIEVFNRNVEEKTETFNQHANSVKEDFSYEKNNFLKDIKISPIPITNIEGRSIGGLEIERTREQSKTIEEILLEDFLMYDTITQKLIKSAELEDTTGIVTFTHLDGSKSIIDLPLEKLLKRGYYDEQTKELVLVFYDDTETRIPAERLVDVYTGTEGNQIQILVSATNEISAIIKNGSIEEGLLSSEVRGKLNKDVYTKAEIDLKETELKTNIEKIEDNVKKITLELNEEKIDSEINADRISDLENEVFEKQTIISESNGLALENTEEGLNLSISEIESNKLEQVTTSVANGDEYDSPSPSNPSEVEGVTGDIKVAVQNKNVASNVKYFNALKEYAGAIFADVQYHKDKYYIVSFDTPNSGDSVYINHGATYGIRRVLSKYDYPCDGSRQIILIQALETAYMKNIPYINKTNYFPDKTTGILSNFMIEEIEATTDEEASTYLPSKYVEHEEQELTISLGNKTLYKGDKIIRKEGKWYFSHIWKKVDDFSTLIKNLTSDGVFRASLELTNKFKDTVYLNYNNAFGNILKLVGNGATYTKKEGFTVGKLGESSKPNLWIYINGFDNYTKEQYKQALIDLGAYFVLPLENEELEEITDTILVSQLNQLLKLKQYLEITNIDFDQDISFEIDVFKSEIRAIKEIDIEQNSEIENLKSENAHKDKVINGLVDSYDTEIVEGDNITINDCLAVPIKDFRIYGKELLPLNNLEYVEENQKILRTNENLIDIKPYLYHLVNNNNISIDIIGNDIVINGTPSANYVNLSRSINITDLLEDGEKYTLFRENNYSAYLQVSAKKFDDSYSYYALNTQNVNFKTFTVDKSVYKEYGIALQLNVTNAVGTLNNYIVKSMLVKGAKVPEKYIEHQSEIINLTNLPNLENYYIYYDKSLSKYFIHDMENPTDTEITDTTLIEQLDKLRAMFLYKGTNNFIVTSENGQPANLKIEAYKDSIKILNDKINNLEQAILNS